MDKTQEIKEYFMLETTLVKNLNEHINQLLSDGWYLFGQTFAFHYSPGVSDMIVYCQAVVKYK